MRSIGHPTVADGVIQPSHKQHEQETQRKQH
jgi:hypothetical protein